MTLPATPVVFGGVGASGALAGAGQGFGAVAGFSSGLRNDALGKLAGVQLGILVLARARFEGGLALSADIKAARIGRFDLIRGSRSVDQLWRAADDGVAPAEPEEGGGDDKRGEQNHEKRSEHLACRNAARLVLVFDRLEPGQLLVIRAAVGHRSTPLGLHGRPTTAQLKWILSIR